MIHHNRSILLMFSSILLHFFQLASVKTWVPFLPFVILLMVNANAKITLEADNVTSVKMDILISQPALVCLAMICMKCISFYMLNYYMYVFKIQIVVVMSKELEKGFVTKAQVNVFVELGTVEQDATNVFRAITVIQIVKLAVVPWVVVRESFAVIF